MTDFSITAKMYGKIIIAEAFLPRKYQTIKPCVVGGLAGGPKYIYNGIYLLSLSHEAAQLTRSRRHVAHRHLLQGTHDPSCDALTLPPRRAQRQSY
jgi:hypothetical protein